jgi:putative membrane protein
MSRAVSWAFFVALAYLLVATLLSRFVHLPTLGNIGFTLVFTGFSASHAGAALGWKRTAAFFAISAIVSWLFEYVGVATGAVYGPYHYGDTLGPKLGGVPVIIPLAWFMMIYPSWEVAGALLGDSYAPAGAVLAGRVLVASMVMTMWDTVMDPGMAASGSWVWERGGPYFGVPFSNYLGWLVTTFSVYLLSGLALRSVRGPGPASLSRWFLALPIIIYALMTSTYLTPRRIESLAPLRLIAAFTMGFASLLALCRICLGNGPRDAAR